MHCRVASIVFILMATQLFRRQCNPPILFFRHAAQLCPQCWLAQVLSLPTGPFSSLGLIVAPHLSPTALRLFLEANTSVIPCRVRHIVGRLFNNCTAPASNVDTPPGLRRCDALATPPCAPACLPIVLLYVLFVLAGSLCIGQPAYPAAFFGSYILPTTDRSDISSLAVEISLLFRLFASSPPARVGAAPYDSSFSPPTWLFVARSSYHLNTFSIQFLMYLPISPHRAWVLG